MKPLRRGMTLLERQKLREEVLRLQLGLAYKRAAEYGLCEPCCRALHATGEDARALHEECTGEEPGGLGCLCMHNDVARAEGGPVVTGLIELPSLPQ